MTLVTAALVGLALAHARAAPAAPAELRKRLIEVVDAFYDLRFDAAAEGARAIEREFPGHPAGPFYAAMVDYQRFLVEAPPSARTYAAFETGLERTIDACAAARATDPVSAERYLGAAHGFKARALVARGSYVSAVGQARKAVVHLRRTLALDPGDDDARFGLGMYDYYIGRAPAAARPLAYLLVGTMGNRARGLEQLHRAAEGSGPGRMEARSVLSAVYASDHERQWAKAYALLEELMARYPGNPLYRLRAVHAAERTGDWERGRRLLSQAGWIDRLDPRLRDQAAAEVGRRLAEIDALASGALKKPGAFRWPLGDIPD
ncbi:MAG: hypothetical protein HY078_01900 [Elusimicrobia bacterium]|nr:hypothetical protein [Elusimicrobiota bacterium]